jgi:hypothetical protein
MVMESNVYWSLDNDYPPTMHGSGEIVTMLYWILRLKHGNPRHDFRVEQPLSTDTIKDTLGRESLLPFSTVWKSMDRMAAKGILSKVK